MSKIEEINKQIAELQAAKTRIQEECSHPGDCVMKTAKSSAGGHHNPCYGNYWYNLHCTLCDKRWAIDQAEWNRKERERNLTKKASSES